MPIHARGMVAEVVVLLVVVLMVSCGDDDTKPTPVGPSPVTTTNIVLTGPQTVAPGATAQFTLTAQLSNGTTQDVTRQSTWSSTSPSRVSIALGLATGHVAGEAMILPDTPLRGVWGVHSVY